MKRYFIVFFFVFSAATTFGQKKVYTKVTITVDTLGTSWKICAHDSTFGLTGFGIKGAILMDGGDCYTPCPVFFNSHIDGDTSFTNQILYSPLDTNVCFTVSVYNIHDSAYAPIFIYDSMGEAALVELRYYPPRVNKLPEEKSESLPFTILPNPAKGNSLIITFPVTDKNAQIIIYDILGREVLREKIPGGILQRQFSIANFENGVYIAHLISDHFRASQKFVIEH